MKLNELESVISIDIKSSLARFGNMESFYVKFLKKFVDDKSFEVLSEGIEQRDIKVISESAHTLKGVTGNLGLTKLFEISQELMKAKDLSEEKILALYEELKVEMEKTREILAKLD